MCGIAGAAWVRADRAVSAETVRRMTDALRHRGPDDEGQYFAQVDAPPYPGSLIGCALGHRRLSIIDVACGHQPLSNEDGSIGSGLFARVKVPTSAPHKGLLVLDRAIGTDQDRRYILVVNAKNEVEYRAVNVGLISRHAPEASR